MQTIYSSLTQLERIRQGALQRAMQIGLQAHKDAEKLQQSLQVAGKLQVDIWLAEQKKQIMVQRRIKRSRAVNSCRLELSRRKHQYFQARHRLCEQIFHQVQVRLDIFARRAPAYQLVLLHLVTEGLLRMFEEQCIIRCLERDRELVTGLLHDCVACFNYSMNQEIQREYPLQLMVSHLNGLTERNLASKQALQKHQEDSHCIGGIVLTNSEGNIVYKNTLDSRMNILKERCLPEVRRMLWHH